MRAHQTDGFPGRRPRHHQESLPVNTPIFESVTANDPKTSLQLLNLAAE
jgi:hypothetical protein